MDEEMVTDDDMEDEDEEMDDEEMKPLMTWLNDAYAMEQSIINTLEGHAKDANDYPEAKQMIEDHIEQTKGQALRIKNEIERLGGEVSKVKSVLADMMGTVQGLMPDLAKDKVIKNAIVEHATEHFEHASYMTLAEAADYYDEPETARVCEEIMEEEVRMGEKLEKALPKLVREYLGKEE
ncbi:MAG: DUF892 family protein [Patescibacteria group bacterium]|jgi:ferritin-like metal-binding protein YciE